MRRCGVLAICVVLASSLAAQEAESSRAPDRGTDVRVHGIQILPVTGKPFSGRDHIEWTRTLEDGSVITTHLYAYLVRDSQGRIYREHRTFVPVNSGKQSRQIDIVLLDPVTHTRTTCILAKRRCTITGYHQSAKFVPPPVGPQGKGTRYLAREALGTDVIDDLSVIGTRETLTINAGVVGNNAPLITKKEYWYSPDLEINLLTSRKDPREGTQVIHVVDLSRTDPDPAIFRVPSNFVVEDHRQANRAEN
jgi:hypothetical protein